MSCACGNTHSLRVLRGYTHLERRTQVDEQNCSKPRPATLALSLCCPALAGRWRERARWVQDADESFRTGFAPSLQACTIPNTIWEECRLEHEWLWEARSNNDHAHQTQIALVAMKFKHGNFPDQSFMIANSHDADLLQCSRGRVLAVAHHLSSAHCTGALQ